MSNSERARIVSLIRKTQANHEYFFDNLDDPTWLPVLAEEGFFKKPIDAERGEGWIRYPFWPESRFLVRVAAKASDEVFEIATGIGETDNVRVHEDLLRISAQLPGKMAAKLVRKEAAWLRDYDRHLMSLPEAAGEALAHLARERQLDAAYEFARALLAISRSESGGGSRRQAVARFHEYAYGRIIERAWPLLLDADAGRAFRFLCDRLSDVIELGYTHEPDGYDSTSSWRPAIEDHGQNHGHSLFDLLVDVVRDYSVELAQTPEGFELVLVELERRPARLFERLRLYVIRQRGPAELVATTLTDPGEAFDVLVWHEYGELLRHRYRDLDDEQREHVLALLDRSEGLQLTERADRHALFNRYAVISEHLTGEARATYDCLREEFAEPDHPTFLSYSTSWTGPTSPFSGEELRAMEPAEVAKALRDWIPPREHEAPSPEGLGRILSDVVAERSDEFAAIAADFKDLLATYVRALLDGLAAAAKEQRVFAWPPVLDICAWVIEQPLDGLDVEDDHRRDPHWGWARKAVAGLLSRGFAEGKSELPPDARHRVWSLLAKLAEDPDPTPAHEQRYGGDNLDPATLSINTTRGEAMHAVLRYAFWVERALSTNGSFDGARSIPEVTALLDRHLDVAVDRSLAVRSVYGQWFPQLVRIDEEWARMLAGRVFPVAPEAAARFAAAWDAYIVFNRPYTDVFPILHQAYRTAIERLDSGNGGRTLAGDPQKRLGEHLMTFRIRGEMTDDDLFATYWRRAQPELRNEVLTGTGWSLEHVERLDSEVADRLRATWEWIVSEAAPDDPALAGFGAWLGTKALDGEWLLEQALAVLTRDIYLEPDFVVYGALQRLATDLPRLVVDVLRRMIATEPEDWSLHGSSAEVRETIKVVLETGDTGAQQRAKELIDLLGARGMTTFRELLRPGAS